MGSKILIVDDEREIADVVALYLQNENYDVVKAYNGKDALRLVEEETTDEETGEVTQTTRLGVYALVNGRTEFKEVEVVTEGSDYYVVAPVGTGRKILRSGDEIITQATGLQDGQLLME